MKKGLGLVVILVSLFSCNIKEEKVRVESLLNPSTFVSIDFNELSLKFSLKENFILFIHSNHCSSCNDFLPSLNYFISSYDLCIYGIDVDAENFKQSNEVVPYQYTPTIAIINNGKVKFKADPILDSEIFVSSLNLSNYILPKIRYGNFVLLRNEKELNYIIDNIDYSFIYFYYKKCSDCSYFYQERFNKFLDENEMQFYGYEMSTIFNNDEKYISFCNQYGLSKAGNNKYGYLNGVVPTFQYYNSHKLSDSCVIFNDSFSYIYDKNGEIISLKMLDSFYQDNPFINQCFNRTNSESAKGIYHHKTISYYYSQFLDFINRNSEV